ncbi:choice-of-anchor U domain-containing protein [Rheinheimera sp. 1928-s]|uniref:choice-of-anchor U domain-containing protein n=1 Tax=Rheinheimera sp. 1928-s TaxID=3033803 RepID=UPI00262BC8D8|nr:choice-of-anchor U domain-containing protein [Rheinheimera sp. 1928-s]MDF3125772.1 M66 family metalloprotease [Rheinheimera sp. 1928-s]
MKNYTLVAVVLLLTGCGGGDGGNENPPPPTSYTVQASAGTGGGISPVSRTVNSGQTATFTVTAEDSHSIQSVTGCAGTLSGQTYTTGPVTANCTVAATFVLKTFAVTSEVSAGEGQITPASRTVNYGDTTTFNLSPATNFEIESVSGCDGSLNGAVYTTAAVTANCTVQARFNPIAVAGSNEVTGEQLGAEVTEDNGWTFGADTVGFIPDSDVAGSPVSLLQGYHALYPLFDFELVKGDEGTSAGVVLSFEAPVPEGSVVLKFGPQTAGAEPQWYEVDETLYSFSENRRSLTLSVTDGELGDDDLTVNGYIKDPVAIAAQLPSSTGTFFPITIYMTGAGLQPIYNLVSAEENTSAVIELAVPTGYQISDVSAEGCDGALNGTLYITDPITAQCHIEVDLEVARFVVTATQSEGGRISPNQQTVNYGDSTEFTLTPDEGFQTDSVTGCAGSLSGGTYTTGAITAACSVSASFIPADSLIVTVQSDEGGQVSPQRYVGMAGDSVSFELMPDSGYSIASATGCAGTLNGNLYEIESLTESCTLVVDFELQQVIVTVQSNAGATIDPMSAVGAYGTQISISIIPDQGYTLSSVTGCDGSLNESDPTNYVYTTGALTTNCQVNVVMAIQTILVSTEVLTGQGQISPSSLQVNYAQQAEFTITPAGGYGIDSVQGCAGALQGNLYRTSQITSPCTVSASFTLQGSGVVPDPLLAAAILETLSLPVEHELTAEDLALLTSLSANSVDILDLAGLEFATSLHTLQLNSTLVSDLTPLADLPLTELRLNFTQVADLTPLAGSPLQDLWLSGTLVNDISALSNMDIRFIDLSGTDVSDISVVSGWQDLYALQLSDTKVLDLTPVVSSGIRNQNTKWVQVYGCLSLKGYSRSQLAINELEALDVSVDAYDKSVFNKGSCPNTVSNTTANLDASFPEAGGQLELVWSVTNPWDNGAWRCSIHFNLDLQQAREAREAIDNCDLDTTFALSYAGSAVKPSVVFEDGLGGKVQADAERLVASDRAAIATYDSYDWGQVVLKTNPKLVAQREALLRIHVTANANASIPDVDVVLTPIVGNAVTLAATAPVQLPRDKIHASLDSSYKVIVPANYMVAGLSVDILVDNQVVEQISPAFAEVNTLSMYIVPIEVEGLAPVVPELTVLNQDLKSFWPFDTVELRVTEPLVVEESSPVDLGDMLDDLTFMAENQSSDVYFYGYVAGSKVGSGQGGLAYRPGKTGVGIDNDSGSGIHAHELGHNLGRPHVDCGDPEDSDLSYPYNTETTGSVGLNLTSDTLLAPEDYTDVMSYCQPQHVSDYNYEQVQDFIQNNPPPAFDVAAQSSEHSAVYIDGHIDEAGQLTIRNLMPVQHSRRSTTEKRLQVVLQDISGQRFNAELNLPQLGHGKAKQQFFYGYLPDKQIKQLQLATDKQSWSFERGNAEIKLQQSIALNSPAVDVQLKGNEVCMNWPAQQFDSATLMHHGKLNSLLLHNIATSGQCRLLRSLPTEGEWVITLRRGLTVKQIRQQLSH